MPRPATRAEVLEAVATVAVLDGTRWVGIDGFGGAGKSTLAGAIADAVPRAVVVHIDDFAGPHVAEWDFDRFERQLAAPLRAGRPARYQVWDWDADTGGDWVDVPPGRVMIVEGVSCTRAEVRMAWDLTVWVDTPREVRLQRALERDGAALLPVWLERWLPSEEAYATRERPQHRVDLIVGGTS
ncbi:MAG: uridine kinase family protein [Jatrophihabitans sp.]|uniref:uridine kinase family protein n=1 Tax=Jatrophihabitans sp. TaxID=1932789 RepID=UPI003F80D8A1